MSSESLALFHRIRNSITHPTSSPSESCIIKTSPCQHRVPHHLTHSNTATRTLAFFSLSLARTSLHTIASGRHHVVVVNLLDLGFAAVESARVRVSSSNSLARYRTASDVHKRAMVSFAEQVLHAIVSQRQTAGLPSRQITRVFRHTDDFVHTSARTCQHVAHSVQISLGGSSS